VDFTEGTGREPYGSFFVDDLKLERIAAPFQIEKAKSSSVDTRLLAPLGGRWFYLAEDEKPRANPPRHYDSSSLDRLAYRIGDHYEFPFSTDKGVWLRKGDLDLRGRLVAEDRWLANPVTVDFNATTMVIHSADIPNHPTGKFPQPYGNQSYIQMHNIQAWLPLDPERNEKARAMTPRNANGALNMGPIGIATNGVVFYNPFDAQMTEAVSIMDRCCGHPDPSNLYHYHKYPVCARSPFEDNGQSHSPLIGWAFDGFPVYGPYEGAGEMAMDSVKNPLNVFNLHYDKDRGWHYHVSPGKFPYIIGGYWGVTDSRNFPRFVRPKT